MSPARESCSTRRGIKVVGGASRGAFALAKVPSGWAIPDACDPGARTPGAVGRFSPGRNAASGLAFATMEACLNALSPSNGPSPIGPGRRRVRPLPTRVASSSVASAARGRRNTQSRRSRRRAGIIWTGVADMTRTPKTPSNSSRGTVPHVLMAATSGLEARKPMMPPALRIARAPSGGLGIPAEMWTRPAAANVNAVVPIVMRFVEAESPGARNSRIPSSSRAIGTFGRVAYAVPIALLLLGIRLLRAPGDSASTNRITIGTTALTFAAAGLVHISAGMPSPPDGALAMRNAGGIIGFLASSPLVAAIRTWGTVPLLLLLGVFGVLVMSATPVHMIPTRLRDLRDWVLRRPPAAETTDDEATLVGKGRTRRRPGPIGTGPFDGDEAFRQAAIVAKAKADKAAAAFRPGEKRPTAPGVLAPGATAAVAGAPGDFGVDSASGAAGIPSQAGGALRGRSSLEAPPTTPMPQLSLIHISEP